MKTLICAATAMEISPFLNEYNTAIENDAIDVLITGIGLTATTYSLTKYLTLKLPDLVIQAGIAGCFDKKIPLSTIVAIKQDVIADENVVEDKTFKTLFDLKLVDKNRFPYKKGWLINKDRDTWKEKTGLRFVKGISVNEITTSKQKIEFYQEAFSPSTESMEGAALHFSCLMEKIPFLQLRGVSNYIGERDKKKWKMKETILNLNNELKRLLTIFSEK
ncbi:MAG: futalosine hydrolase [Bacteroidota bacterium]